MTNKSIASTLVLTIVLLVTSACVSLPAKETSSPAMAEFEITSLDIQPPEVIAGYPTIITATVRNIGSSEGAYTAILTLDGVILDTKEVVITAGSSAHGNLHSGKRFGW